MAHLAYQASSAVQQFKGTQYQNPDKGTHKICLRTGTGKEDIVKYGLTSNISASAYCGIKFKIMDKEARIGRYELMQPIVESGQTEEKSSLFSRSIYTESRTVMTTTNRTSSAGASSIPLQSINIFMRSSSLIEKSEDNNFFIDKSIEKSTFSRSTTYRFSQSTRATIRLTVSYRTYHKTYEKYTISSNPKSAGEDNFNL